MKSNSLSRTVTATKKSACCKAGSLWYIHDPNSSSFNYNSEDDCTPISKHTRKGEDGLQDYTLNLNPHCMYLMIFGSTVSTSLVSVSLSEGNFELVVKVAGI